MLSLLAMICLGGYSAVGDTYKLVTSVNDLYNGDVIVIANNQYNKAMGMQNTNNRASVDISFTDDSKESFNLVAKVAVLTLKKPTINGSSILLMDIYIVQVKETKTILSPQKMALLKVLLQL